jgi:hypothetical protein
MSRIPFKKPKNVIWTPHPGSQVDFLECPIHEVLLHGNRGGGKTDVLLMDFLQDVGVGYGADWRGILFREEYTQLTDIINKSKKWISQIFPGAKWNGTDHSWRFPEGETLYLRYMRLPGDYWGYHGHEYPWQGWEELTNWATDECYKMMMSTNRSSNPNVPRKIRATCNPAGVGHSWVKHRFIDVAPPKVVYRDVETGKGRVHIVSSLSENTTLLEADPNYQMTIISAVQDDPVKRKAWIEGSWDIVAGGFFADLWDSRIHVIPKFPFPKSWDVHRSFDWGSTKPWAVTYGAECNGEQPDVQYGMPYLPKGSVIGVREIYGWNGTVNTGDQATSADIAERTKSVDDAIELEYRARVRIGPADTSIWEVRDGTSIAKNMSDHGLWWHKAYKGSGSRVAGWSLIRTMLGAAKRRDLEHPHLYFFEDCRHHIRTIPIMQHDPNKPEDLDSSLEDHCCDSLRYLLARKLNKLKQRKVRT